MTPVKSPENDIILSREVVHVKQRAGHIGCPKKWELTASIYFYYKISNVMILNLNITTPSPILNVELCAISFPW